MSLKKKIALSFIISAAIIAVLAVFEYANFLEIRKDIRYLETTDTIRSKSLQLRRHEKNYFLYGLEKAPDESALIYKYLGELDSIVVSHFSKDRSDRLSSLKDRISEYRRHFSAIDETAKQVSGGFGGLTTPSEHGRHLLEYIKATFMDKPLQTAKLLRNIYGMKPDNRIITNLIELDAETQGLRKIGEDVLNLSKELDISARANVERVINLSQTAILIFFPLFLLVGIGMLFFISGNVVKRLRLLMDVAEKTGKGSFPHITALSRWGRNDEVGLLVQKFNTMEDNLSQREQELEKKKEELLRAKKLAAIGTLAAGVAHELNNPLNNIAISAQMLKRETGAGCPESVHEIVNDIVGQTARVKKIVGDLLEFARGRQPILQRIELNELILGTYKLVSTASNTENITFIMNRESDTIHLNADPEQIERVFINLFSNSVDAMDGSGELTVNTEIIDDNAVVKLTDRGKGMSRNMLEKIFEPFYSTKDKGTGLGLAIVFNIIKKHNGTITVDSEEGKGTCFTITLPLLRG